MRTMWSIEDTVQAGVDIARQGRSARGELADSKVGKGCLGDSRGKRSLATQFIASIQSFQSSEVVRWHPVQSASGVASPISGPHPRTGRLSDTGAPGGLKAWSFRSELE